MQVSQPGGGLCYFCTLVSKSSMPLNDFWFGIKKKKQKKQEKGGHDAQEEIAEKRRRWRGVIV